MKEVLIVSPSLAMGGIERALVVLASQFNKEGVKVHFLPCLPTPVFFQLDDDISVVRHGFKLFSGPKNKILFYWKLIRFIRQKAKEIDPDAVLCFGDVFNPIVLLALYNTSFRVFISDRTSPDYAHSFPVPFLKKTLYPRATGFIAQTGRAYRYKEKQFNGKLKMQVIPNAIRSFELPEAERRPVILYVGRFAWEKAPERLIKAFAMIKEAPDWELHMSGSGPQLEEMKFLADSLGIADKTTFLGKVSNVDELYASSSIFVLPSVLEGFPNALCEAMSAGLACICFDSIPYEEILEPGESGEVVQDGDIKGLAKRIEYLVQNPWERERLGSAARQKMQALQAPVVGRRLLKFIFPEDQQQ